MARIRSVHPGFFTDEDIVEVSLGARLLLIGLGVEADDKGTFPWKPKTLKMRIFPADTLEVAPLLDELAQLGLIKRYESGGKYFGAIRNFRKHQRPKSPNDVNPCPDEIFEYVGLCVANSESEDALTPPTSEMNGDEVPPIPPSGENSIQMEDGGWRMDSLSNDKQVDFDDFWKLWPDKVSKKKAQLAWASVPVGERAVAASVCASWHRAWKARHPSSANISPATYLDDRRWTDAGFSNSDEVPESEVLAFYAETVLSKKKSASSTVSPAMAGRLIAANLVTPEQLSAAGVST